MEKSFYKSKAIKQKVEQLYFEKLDELNITYDRQVVDTSFGQTNVLITGNTSGKELVLIHGSNGCAPIGIEALIGLLDDYKIYAVDVIGQPNLSAETRPDMKGLDYGKWMYEVMSRLGVEKVIMVGISFGGFITWKSLLYDQRKIQAAHLIVPAGIVNGNPLKALFNVFMPMKRYMRTQKKKHVLRFTAALFSYRDDFANRFLATVFGGFEMDFSPIPTLKKAEAEKITVPVSIYGAEKDVMFPGVKMLRRARRIFPSLKEAVLIKGAKHVPDDKGNHEIIRYIQ